MPKVKTDKRIRRSVDFTPDDYARVVRLGDDLDRSISWIVRQAVRRYLDEHEGKEEK